MERALAEQKQVIQECSQILDERIQFEDVSLLAKKTRALTENRDAFFKLSRQASPR